MSEIIDPEDGGLASRKLWFGIGSSGAICVLAILGAWCLPALLPVLPEVIGGLIGVLSLYIGGNLGAKFLVSRHTVQMAGSTTTDETESVEKPQPKP
jgi:hypothetical protein